MYRLFSTILISVTALALHGQTGLWEVVKVFVGTQEMTPVSKWFDINEDGTVMSGNGGLINIRGTYDYDESMSEFVFSDESGVLDPAGGFKVEFDDNNMTWMRNEDGMDVTVSLVRVNKIPFAPWDKCAGAWIPENEDFATSLFMSWDRSFRINGPEGNKRGVWHIPAHSPDLTLYHQDGSSTNWIISFPDDDTMVWKPEFGDDQIFKREAEGR